MKSLLFYSILVAFSILFFSYSIVNNKDSITIFIWTFNLLWNSIYLFLTLKYPKYQ